MYSSLQDQYKMLESSRGSMKNRKVLITWVISASSFITLTPETTTYIAALTKKRNYGQHISSSAILYLLSFVAAAWGRAATRVNDWNEIIFITLQGTAFIYIVVFVKRMSFALSLLFRTQCGLHVLASNWYQSICTRPNPFLQIKNAWFQEGSFSVKLLIKSFLQSFWFTREIWKYPKRFSWNLVIRIFQLGVYAFSRNLRLVKRKISEKILMKFGNKHISSRCLCF